MSGKFNPYDLKAFRQTLIVLVFLLGFVAVTAAAKGHGV
jgi:hypothetical protein